MKPSTLMHLMPRFHCVRASSSFKPPCPYTYIHFTTSSPHSHHPFSSLSYPSRSCLYPLVFFNYTHTDIPPLPQTKCNWIIDSYITMDSSNKNTPSGTVPGSATTVNRVVGQSCLVHVCLFASRYCYAYAVCNLPKFHFAIRRYRYTVRHFSIPTCFICSICGSTYWQCTFIHCFRLNASKMDCDRHA